MRLFELAGQYKALEALGASTDDIAPEVIADTLEGLLGDFQEKAVNVAKFILSLEAAAEDIKEAADAMSKRAVRLEKRAEAIRHYLLLQMQIVDQRKFETPEIVIARRANPPSVQVATETDIPDQYWVQPPAPPKRIDKIAIRNALATGTAVPGCYLESGESVRITL